MVRRDQLPRGVAWSHSKSGDPLYLALGVKDYERLGSPVPPTVRAGLRVWSVSICEGAYIPISNGLVWCRDSSVCFLHPPDTWSPSIWLEIHDTVERMARVGVLLTPMCGLLYR